MLSMRRSVLSLAVACGAALTACRSPTQIEVDVTTNLDCGVVTETAFTPGLLVGIEGAPPATTSTTCKDGHLGSMVMVPSGDENEVVAFKVVTGFNGTRADQCSADAGYAGNCIVARRSLRYLPHTTLQVAVKMSSSCIGNDCGDPTMTCVEGACVPATIADPSQCQGAGCDEKVLLDGGVLPEDLDATPPEDATIEDATVVDSTIPIPDAAPDATLQDAGQDSAIPDAGTDSTIPDATPDANDAGPTDAGVDTSAPPFDAGAVDGQVAGCDLGGLQPGAPWPMSNYCPSHRGRSPLLGPTATPTRPWVFPLAASSGELNAAPAIAADGTLYVATTANYLETITPDGARILEQHLTGNGGKIEMAPVLAFDQTVRLLETMTNDYITVALDGGATVVTPINTASSAGLTIVSGGRMYFGDPNGSLNAFNNQGVEIWHAVAVSNENDVVAVNAAGEIFTGYDGVGAYLNGVNPGDGGTFWSWPTATAERVQDIAIATDQTIRGLANNNIYAFDPSLGDASAALIWHQPLLQTSGMAVGDDGWTYIGAGSSADGGGLYVYDPVAGVRTHGVGTGSCGPPILDAAENVYAWCDGAIVAYPKHLSGAILWSLDLTQTFPAYPGGWFLPDTLVLGQESRLYFTAAATLGDGGTVQVVVGLRP